MKENVRIKANAMKETNDISMKGEIVIFGSTYMSRFPIYELAHKCLFENAVYNRSIEGLTVKEALEIVKDCVIDLQPSKIFLALGEEDEEDPDVLSEYSLLVDELRAHLPESRLYLIGLTGTGAYEEAFNRALGGLCDGKRIRFISFVTKPADEMTLYKARFKQLSSFFRDQSVTVTEVFALTDLS